ncbi:MAG TPA: hypothetical protein VMR41_03150 [Patescibacteria group bacterium]|nr:hypothetical protein [Patescibacteria group bacterium]
MFILIIISLAVISVVWSFLSLQQSKKHEETKKVKKKLEKGRVIFYKSSSGSGKA